MIKCVIIEDEPQAVDLLKSFLAEEFPKIEIVANFDKISLAANFIKNGEIDFIFLDVQLSGELGIDIAQYLSKEEFNFEIIFTTAYSGFALEAFALSAIDYLLKPLKRERLIEAVNRVLKRKSVSHDQLKLLSELTKTEKIEKIIIKNNDGKFPLNIDEICYLKADNVYTEFHLVNSKRIIVSKPLKDYESLISSANFIKPHRSYLINSTKIVLIQGTSIIMNNNDAIPIARDKKREFHSYIK
jgi:two-component system LytT family response regulator